MANVLNGNTFFIDTATGSGGATFDEKNIIVTGLFVTGTGSAAILVLSDASTPVVKKLEIQLPAAIDTKFFPLEEAKILFPNGIDPTTVTNAKATVVFKRQGGGR